MVNFFCTIRRKIILPIILLMFAIAGAIGLTACSADVLTEEDIIDMGYTISVWYEYNGGVVNGKETNKQIRVQEGSYLPNPSRSDSHMVEPSRVNYSFRDFCVAKTDEEGKPIRDEKGDFIADRVWNFATDKATEDITLFARWWDNYKLVLHYGEGYGETKETVYIARNSDGSPSRVTQSAFEVRGTTFLDYYYDREGTKKLTIPSNGLFQFDDAVFAQSDDKLTVNIWGDSLNGVYKVIRSASDLSSFSYMSNTNIYLDVDIDMQEVYANNREFTFPSVLEGKFIGNNHTISNLNISKAPEKVSDTYFGLIDTIDTGAEIRDVTFENVTLDLNLSNPNVSEYTVGMLAGRVRENAILSNVKISGTLKYEVVSGFDIDSNLVVNDLIGTQLNGAQVGNDVKANNLAKIGSRTIVSTDGAFAVYVRFTQTPAGDVTLGDVYGLAQRESNGALKAISLRTATITNLGEGKFKIATRNNKNVYDIEITDNAGEYSATVVHTTNS